VISASKPLIDDLSKAASNWPQYLKTCKDKNVLLVGSTGRFVPEELIYAAGAKPYLICRGGEPEPPDAVLPYMLRFMSPYARAQIGYYLLGIDPVIPILDLIVAQCTDCHMARLADLFEYFDLPTMKIGVPLDWDKPIAQEYYYKGLIKLRQKLEDLTGNVVSENDLRKSIDAFNRMRDILKSINILRKKDPPPIGGYDFIRLNHYSFCCDIYEIQDKLEHLYKALESTENAFPKEAPRILLLGHVVAIGDYVVSKLIETAGGVVVAELLDEGMRYYEWKVDIDGDLMKNLSETYYLQRTPASIFNYAWRERLGVIENIIEDFHIDGVLWYQLSFDEIYSLESSIVSRRMEALKIPFLRLESSYEYSREAMGPLTTRIESFIESIKDKKEKR